MFESLFIIFCCLCVCCIFIYLFIEEEKLRKKAKQPTLRELNKIYKEYKKENRSIKNQKPKKVWEDIPLFMDKEEFLKIQ